MNIGEIYVRNNELRSSGIFVVTCATASFSEFTGYTIYSLISNPFVYSTNNIIGYGNDIWIIAARRANNYPSNVIYKNGDISDNSGWIGVQQNDFFTRNFTPLKIIYADGRYVIFSALMVADKCWTKISNDGETWNYNDYSLYTGSTVTSVVDDVVYAENKFVCSSHLTNSKLGQIRWCDSSGDTLLWNYSLSGSGEIINNGCYGDGKWVFCSLTKIYTSSDLMNWNILTGITSGNTTNVFYGDGNFYCHSGNRLNREVRKSSHGINWEVIATVNMTGTTSKIESYKDCRFLTFISDGSNINTSGVYHSTDGVNWFRDIQETTGIYTRVFTMSNDTIACISSIGQNVDNLMYQTIL
jgi:hypothetical protein